MIHDPGQPIAYGRTAEIYPWGRAEVLKLFYEWFELENIDREARLSRAVHAGGLPVPSVGEIIHLKSRHGLIYERIHGTSMWKMFQQKPWQGFACTRRWAELHAAIHATRIQVALPSQREKLRAEIQQAEKLAPDLKKKVLNALKGMPEGDCLCHGDFWPGNILVTPHGEVIIDWIHATRGNPMADIARSLNLAYGFMQTRQSERPFLSYDSSKVRRVKNSLLQALCNIFIPVYLHHYFRLRPGDREEVFRWLPIIAAARLSDNIPELEEMLMAQVEKITQD